MQNKLQWTMNTLPQTDDRYLPSMNENETTNAMRFHMSFPQYKQTPLVSLTSLADKMGLQKIYVKDESFRFGLNAFKVLGGSYAIARFIAKQTNRDWDKITYDWLTSKERKDAFHHATFFTATDGNHGRGVAWAANQLGQGCVIHMPKGTTQARLDHIAAENATVTIEDVNYDECVRIAAKEAAECEHGVLIQDTAWDGYEEIPTWIMEGYGTLAAEANEQIRQDDCNRPTHVFVQAGVGCLAGAIVGYFANQYPENPPVMVVVEANAADCLYRSAIKGTGERVIVNGDMPTIMAGLACGEPNTISWDILRNHASAFCSCPDTFSCSGTCLYYHPIGNDVRIISGESGSVTLGLLEQIMCNKEYRNLREALSLDSQSNVLLISTEGNTDPDRFREILSGAIPKI